MGNPKSPLGDGRSGAGPAAAPTQPRVLDSIAPQRAQRVGTTVRKDSVSVGGRALKLDPPTDRQGMVGTTADPSQRKPYKLGIEGLHMPPDDPDGMAPVGSVPGDEVDDDNQ
jgi:hypothetical protein